MTVAQRDWLESWRSLLLDAAYTDEDRRAPTSLVRQSLREDVGRGLRGFISGSLAGSVLVPRVLRFVLLRLCGVDVRTANIFEHCTFDGGNIHIGRATFINQLCYFEGVGELTIGQRCQIGVGVIVLTSAHPFGTDGLFSRLPAAAKTTIGDRCWLGAGSIVLPGVTIGDDVVIGAGSVVTTDCAPAGVYVGAPARRIRDLETISAGPRGAALPATSA